MPRSLSGVIAWARNEAARGNILSNWAGWCEKFANNAGAFNYGYNSATLAGNASNPRDVAPQAGMLAYYSGAGGDGHVGFVLTTEADPIILMASAQTAAAGDHWGHNIGTIRQSTYLARVRGSVALRGYSWNHGPETLDRSTSVAGDTSTPISNSGAAAQKKEDDVKLTRDERGNINFTDEFGSDNLGIYGSSDITNAELISAADRVFGPVDQLNNRESDVSNAIAARRWSQKASQIAGLAAAQVAAQRIDFGAASASISDAVIKAITTSLAGQSVKVDLSGIPAAVDAVLADNFANIPKSVLDAEAERLKS